MNDNPTSQCRAEESEVSISQKYLYSHVWNIIHNSLDLKTTLSVINRWKNRKKWYICTMGGEGNGNLLQHSCLEYPRDGGAWWAAICGVAQSQTWLKWLSSSSSSMYNGRKAWQSIQCSYLENPMDRGTWWAKIHRVAKSQTQLKWLSMVHVQWHSIQSQKGGNSLVCNNMINLEGIVLSVPTQERQKLCCVMVSLTCRI